MISLFTGGEVRLVFYPQEIKFRNISFIIEREAYECIDTGKCFTTTEQDQIVCDELLSQYSIKMNEMQPKFTPVKQFEFVK